MSEDFNLSLTADNSSGLVTEGVHYAKCISVKKEPNKARDGDNLVFEFEILSEGQQGRKLRFWQSLKTEWAYTKTFRAFGLTPGPNGKFQLSSKSFVGKKVRLQVKNEDYRGEMSASVDRILDPNGPAEHKKEVVTTQDDVVPPTNASRPKVATLTPKKPTSAAKPAPADDDEDQADQEADEGGEEEQEKDLPF